jgi:chromosome segregation ATPase
MTLKLKLIVFAIIAIAIIAFTICIFVYISNLNNKITDLNVKITEQQNEIQSLNCQIDSLEKNVESFIETINVTNTYIENLEKAKQEESNVKQEIYNTVINDPDTKEWYDEPLPDALLQVLMRETEDLTCND